MGKYAQLVIGPAGSGKSTYCRSLYEHIISLNSNYKGTQKRHIHLVNLDPAVDDVVPDDSDFNSESLLSSTNNKNNNKQKNEEAEKKIYSFSITDLITLEDVMEEMELGPNGALLYCMEYFISELNEWLSEHLGDFDEDYLVFDCPGQIELYTHVPLMRQFTNELMRLGYRVATVYCMDAQFIHDTTKFMSGSLMCLSAMTMFQDCPHFNILTKCDLIKQQLQSLNEDNGGGGSGMLSLDNAANNPLEKQSEVNLHEQLEEYLVPDTETLLYRMQKENTNFMSNERFMRLHTAIAQLISDYSLVSYLPLDITDEESIDFVLNNIDHSVQYGEDLEAADPYENEDQENMDQDYDNDGDDNNDETY